jgi:tRNA nucleotidyltransferase (CCA-adding enzyme)
MDLDCLGSLILVKKLFPGYRLLRSRIIHPTAYGLYNLYKEYFDFLTPPDVAKEIIDHIIIVDTSSARRVKEYFNAIRNSEPRITIYDHHPGELCDIQGAELLGRPWGSAATCLGKLAMERGIRLESEEATIVLTGIYADTGRLIYENVRREDLEVAAWLLDMGASLRLVKSFLETIKEDDQMLILNQLLLIVQKKIVQGHEILLSYLELEDNIPGLAPVVEKIMDIENPDAYFAVFYIRKNGTILVIARSQKERIDLHSLLTAYGGGGHQLAASLLLRGQEGPRFREEFLAYLENSLAPATRAADIMTTGVYTINEDRTILEASMYLEEVNHTGVPVLDGQGKLSGFLSLRDIMKARRGSRMQDPVKLHMTKEVISSHPGITMREVERLFYKHHIGHLPIVEDGRLTGILTSWDFLEYKKRRKGRAAQRAENSGAEENAAAPGGGT